MNNWKIAIYFSKEYGVIFVDHIPVVGKCVCTPVNPVGYPMNVVSDANIGKTVFQRMSKVAITPPIDKERPSDYWHISGIKGFKKFSMIFSSVRIYTKDSVIYIEQMKTPLKTGGYTLDRSKPIVNLPYNVAPEVLGATLLTILRNIEPKDSDSGREEIVTAAGNRMSYKIPGEEFDDCGDGHTDAYKVYQHLESDETMLAFMIDSGYKGYDASSIKEKWEQWYGILKDFSYEPVAGKIIIKAKNSEIELAAYLYQSGEETTELFTAVDKKAFKGRALTKIRKEFETVAQSVQFLS